MDHKPIDDYGIIGDLHTAALVGNDGSIDWCCLPHFDSPSVFGAILDIEKGGHFRVSGVGKVNHRQLYYPETNVLITRFSEAAGVVRVMDFMPVLTDGPAEDGPPHAIIRHVQCLRGETRVRMECFPAFNYARTSHRVERYDDGVVFVSDDGDRLGLTVARPYVVRDGAVECEFTLQEGGEGGLRTAPPPARRGATPPQRGGGLAALRADDRLLAALAGEVQLQGPLAGDGAAVLADP